MSDNTGHPMDPHHHVLGEAGEVLESEYTRITRLEPRLRRFQRVMKDLLASVPADWATINDDETVDFSRLSPAQFDRLVCLFEDIAMNRPIRVTIVRGGPNLFDPGAPVGPSTAPVASTVHMSVPR